MINILLPMASKSKYFSGPEYRFPSTLIEINGKPLIEAVIENLDTIKGEKTFIFVVNQNDCSEYHIDDVLSLVAGERCRIIKLAEETRGAACSALMAVEYIGNADRLIIANCDQLIEEDLNGVIGRFDAHKADAGVVTFEAIHPRWSYVLADKQDSILEVAEKRPISRNAIAGFYYFRRGGDFIRAACAMIEKDAHVDGQFYIAPAMNEMVLENKKLEIYRIPNGKYCTFYSPQKIKEYELKYVYEGGKLRA